MRSKIAVLLFGLFIWLQAFHAYADWEQVFFQVTCNHDINFFSVKSFTLESVDALSEEKAEVAGIYSMEQLNKNPVTCQLRPHAIVVEMDKYSVASATGGACAGVAGASLSIKMNNSPVTTIRGGGGWGLCGQDYQEEVMLSPSRKEKCRTSFNSKWEHGVKVIAPTVTCNLISLDWWKQANGHPR